MIGYNYRMTNIEAAIGLAQLERIDEFTKNKKQLADWYIKYLDLEKVDYHRQDEDVVHSYWMFSILVKNASMREPLRKHLADHNIETRPLFYPIHTMPMYSNKFHKHEVAEDLGWRGINLPSFPGLTEEQVKFIAGLINEF